MSNQHDPVKPTPFNAAPEPDPTRTPTTATPGAPGRWVAPLFIMLLVAAAAVIFWLPGKVPETRTAAAVPAAKTGSPEVSGVPAATGARPAPPAEAATPYADGLAARERDAAQAVLEQVLDTRFALEEQGVERWANEEFTRAGRLAAEGDEQYRRREFTQATASYQAALAALESLAERVPQVLAEALAATRQALEDSAVALAREQVATAALLAPQSPDVAALQARVDNAAEVARLREDSATAAASGDLPAAIDALKQALALDGEHLAVARDRERLEAALLDQDFSAAMSEGYAALARDRFGAARAAFARAAALKPDAAETGTALAEVATEETAYTLRELAAAGSGAERRERWQEAVEQYEKALELDNSVLFAVEGLARARPRAKLDEQLSLLLREPERLQDKKVANAAARLLEDARAFGAPDEVLRAQVDELSELVRKANTPVTVTLHSDAQTEVVVHKVARLGRFERHSLSLRPGTYTAVGSRRGYRDVRESFTVAPGAGGTAITIRCTEPI